MNKLVIATRKSPLALAQAEMVATRLREAAGVEVELKKLVTTGDRQAGWSLEERGGKGLFTKELEEALLSGGADLAVHSTKDLPGEMAPELEIAGYLPRADARDVLVMRAGVTEPRLIATGSPRRRLQIGMLFPHAEFAEIRGNVDTRLRKIGQDGVAEATLLAAAGLARLGIGSWPGVEFHVLGLEHMVPAVGQAAIAVQSRAGEGARFADAFDDRTRRTVSLERAFQTALDGGCHTAFGVHATADTLWFFHHEVGLRSLPLSAADLDSPAVTAQRTLRHFGFQE